MSEQEVRELIYRLVVDEVDRYMRDDRECVSTLKREIEQDWLPIIKGYSKRMAQIEHLVQQHTIGVQNVYDQFAKITDTELLANFNNMSREFKRDLHEIQAQCNQSNEFVKRCEKKMSVINDIYSLRNVNSGLIQRIASIVNAIKEDNE